MAKKEGNIESCQCGGNCCCGKVWLILLSLIGAAAAIVACIYSCKAFHTAEKAFNVNVLSAGWIENLEKMNDLYRSEAYVKYATEQTEGYVNSFLSQFGDADAEWTDDGNDDGSNVTAWGDEIKAVVEDLLASSPIRWDKNARFTIVEYTELLCPYCQRHSSEGTINAVIEQFPGEVNSISKSFIIHWDEALKLSSAMECVAELKPEVYHETFEKAFEAYPVDMDSLISIATGLGVDEAALKTCADEWRYTQAVNDAMSQASSLFGVSGTPGNVIIDRETGNYRLVSGAYPVDEFVNAINELKNA